MPTVLRRRLGVGAVAAIVVGDMLGSGVFFAPGELAAVAERPWQVYVVWALGGVITLCGALTLAELCGLLPRAGASYHVLREAYGPFWGFLKVWMEMWVSGTGSVAGLAIVFGELAQRAAGGTAAAWGAAAIVFFAAVNALGIEWGARTQVTLTAVKLAGLLGLVGGAWLLATPAAAAAPLSGDADLLGFVRVVGLGVAAVLFTYDGWIDVSHVAGEVRRPERDLPLGLGVGVAGLTLLYLAVNHAYLRVVPLDAMREGPTTIATRVADAAFGPRGAALLDALVLTSVFGALGGLVMTLPRIYYTLAAEHAGDGSGLLRAFFRRLGMLSRRSATPIGAIAFTAAWSIVALLFFGSFSRLVNFIVVPLQLASILMVSAVFRLRSRVVAAGLPYRTPGYPVTPLVFIVVMLAFLGSALAYRPRDTLIGAALTATGIPVYRWLRKTA